MTLSGIKLLYIFSLWKTQYSTKTKSGITVRQYANGLILRKMIDIYTHT